MFLLFGYNSFENRHRKLRNFGFVKTDKKQFLLSALQIKSFYKSKFFFVHPVGNPVDDAVLFPSVVIEVVVLEAMS